MFQWSPRTLLKRKGRSHTIDESKGTKLLNGQRKKTALFYEVEAGVYDKRRWSSEAGHTMDRTQRTIVRELAESCRRKRVLEIGPGTGRFSIELAQHDARLYLADIALNMLRVARKRLGEIGLGETSHVSQADIEDLPFQVNSFDLCVAINVFSHLDDPVRSFSEVARVLAPGGSLIVNVPNLWSFYFPIGLIVNLRKRSVLRDVYSHWYNIIEIRRICHLVGLELQRLVGHVHFPNSRGNVLVLSLLTWLDRISRRSLLRYSAPTIFIKAVKPRRP